MTRPVAENLFVADGETTCLLAGRNRSNGRLVFPFPAGPEAEAFDLVRLSAEGVLWSYTIQRFCPKPPYNGDAGENNFVPYGVGYVEFPGQLIVEGRIVAAELEALTIGETMRVTTEAYSTDASGQAVLTYAFTPADQHPGATR